MLLREWKFNFPAQGLKETFLDHLQTLALLFVFTELS